MEPTPLEIRPAPPEPTRLNRRAGFAALLVLGLLLGAIVYGVATRQGASLRMSEQERGAESATSAGTSPGGGGTKSAWRGLKSEPPIQF